MDFLWPQKQESVKMKAFVLKLLGKQENLEKMLK